MTVPALPEPESHARYGEAELVRILRVAAELQDRESGETTADTLTLADVQQIASEVGIDPRYVAAAARLVATEAGERWTPWLLAPVRGRLTRALPGAVPTDAWQEIIAIIGRSMERPGRHSYVPGALEWVHADAGTEVRVEVSASRDGTHVQLTADHRQAATMYLATSPVLGASAAVLLMAALGGPGEAEAALLVGGGAAGGLLVGWGMLRAMAARWQRRMRSALQELAMVADRT
jgi:hypothetical protein